MKHTRIIVWLVLAAITHHAWAQLNLPTSTPPPKRQAMFAAADGSMFWLVLALDADRFQLLHRDADSPPNVLHPALDSSGHPINVAAGDHKLFLIYDDQSVQAVQVNLDVRTGAVSYRVNQLPPLPTGAKLLNLTAGPDGPLAVTTPPPTPPPQADSSKEQPADAQQSAETPTQESDDQPTKPEPTGPFRLYTIDAGRWKPTPMPDDLRPGDDVRVRIVGGQPVIFANRHEELAVYRLAADGSWHSHKYAGLPLPRSAQLAVVMGQIVIVAPKPDDPAMLHAQLLHEGRLLDAGLLPLPKDSVLGWRAVAMGSKLTVVTASASSQWLVQRDLTDAPDTPATSIELTIAARPTPPFSRELMSFGLIAILVLFVMATWRSKRLGTDVAVDLPPTMVPAELPRRIIASIIDLLPGCILAMILYDITNPMQLLTGWPGMTDDLTQLAPAIMIIGVFLIHSTLSELFTATTLGKRLAGLRVVTVKGQPPNIWQVFTRNVIKIMELLLPLLLLMVLLSPARQRMGDLAGRTVVVRKTDQPSTPNSPSE